MGGVKQKGKPKPAGFFKLFRYVAALDVLLMILGLVAAFFSGAAFPIAMNMFGDITNLFVNHQISRDLVSTAALQSCPSNTSLSVNISSVTGGVVDCVSSYTFGMCTFTLNDFLQTACYSDDSFTNALIIQIYAILAIAVGAFILYSLHVWLFQTAAERQTHRIRLRYYQTILKQDIGWFEKNSSGGLANRLLSGLDKIHKGIGDNLSIMIQWVSTFIFALGVGLYRQWQLALLLCVIIPFMALAGALFSSLGAIFSNREEKSYASAGGIAEEVLSSIKTVFVFGGQKKECARYNDHLTTAKKDGVLKGATSGFSVGVIYFLIFLIFSVSFWFGGFLVAGGLGQVGNLVTVFFAFLVGLYYLGQVGSSLANLSDAREAAGEIYSTIDRPLIIDSSSEDGLKPDDFEPTVEFKNVDFTNPSRPDTQVLHGLELRADVGQTVALVGPSGSGKSTVIDLIERFYELSSGQVLIGGHDIKDLNLKWLRSQIGLVSQEPVLFDTTIAENIRYGKEDATFEEIQEAAKNANAHDFITSLPRGYDTLVSERGNLLKSGQKQRIAIARALIRNPKILLLDEATSALDTESEKIVQKALDAASDCVGRTTIVVAHRLSTIQNADLIIMLDNGRVVESGTHSELLSKGGLYSDLCNTQAQTPPIDTPRYIATTTSQKTVHSKTWKRKNVQRSLLRAGAPSTSVRRRVTPPPFATEEEKLPDVSSWRIMKNLRSGMWVVVFFGVVASFVNGLVFPAFAIVFGEALRVFTGEPDSIVNNLHPWGGTFLALGVVLAVSSFIKHLCLTVSGKSITPTVRSKLFKAILRQEVGWFDDEKNSIGALTTKLSYNASQLGGAAGIRLGTALENFTAQLAALAVAFAYSWITTFVLIGVWPVVILGSFIRFATVGAGANATNKRLRDASEVALESVDNIKTVASFGLENKYYQVFKCEVEGAHKLSLVLSVLFGFSYGLAESLLFLVYIIIFRFGAFLVTRETDHPLYFQYQDVYRAFAALVFGSVTMGLASSFTPDYSKAKRSAGIVYAILDRKPEIDNYSEDGLKPEKVRGEIEFDNVFFGYPQRFQNVLSWMNLKVKQGQTLALVGASGSGRSTILSLIERFYDPQAGSIHVNGVNVIDINLSWLRSQLGIVSQEPVLFDATIAENIRYGALFREVSDEEVIEAAKSANIHSFIETLPMGYNTSVGGKGTQLSGGQKQGVAIARVLLRDPKVLLLDEATSTLDSESEKTVQEALDKAREGRTCIVIAHRLSTIYNSDCIAVLREGKVAESGTHQELLEKKGLYYKLNGGQEGRSEPEAKEEL